MDREGKNYYEILEVSPNCSQEDIYQGYTRSKNAYSGDSLALYSLLSNDECSQVLNLIEEAYSVLGDPRKRQEYNRFRGLGAAATEENSEKQPEKHLEKHPEKQSGAYQGGKQQSREMGRDSFNNAQANATNLMNATMDMERNNQRDFSFDSSMPASNTINEMEREKDFNINRHDDAEVSKIMIKRTFSLDYDVDPEFEQVVEETTSFTGEILQKIREYKNVTIERLADMTKISKTHLRNIESENYEKLPALVYTRGFVFQYAKTLKLNPDIVATSYVHNLKAAQDGTNE